MFHNKRERGAPFDLLTANKGLSSDWLRVRERVSFHCYSVLKVVIDRRGGTNLFFRARAEPELSESSPDEPEPD